MTTGNNQFLPFATGSSANVLTAAEYEALTALVANGFQSGIAQSQQVNTPIRQATFVAAAIAQIIANNGVNANDDGNIAEFVTNLLNSIYTSPALTGNPTAPTQTTGDSSNKLATTGFVNQASYLNSNGYQKFPSGLIIQWGQTAQYTDALQRDYGIQTFPVAFPNACFIGNASMYLTSYQYDSSLVAQVYAMSKTGMGICLDLQLTAQPSTHSVTWIAIGN